MTAWNIKTSSTQALLLLSCLAIAFPGLVRSGLCQDNDCCSSARTVSGSSDMESPCSCTQTVEEKPSCCQTKAIITIQQSCTCRVVPPATQPCPVIEKTEKVNPSLMLSQQLVSVAIPTTPADAGCYTAKVAPPSGPELLRSVILLI